MGRIDDLADRYERHIRPRWQRNLAGAQRTIFIVYPKEDERRLRARRHEFEVRTKATGRQWAEVDLTTAFAQWMATEEYKDAYFDCPEDLDMKLRTEFIEFVVDWLRGALTAEHVDENTVVGVLGAASLYGFTRLSDLLPEVEPDIRGKLLVFFPGEYESNNYRLLDARDGWNYLATPITIHQGDAAS